MRLKSAIAVTITCLSIAEVTMMVEPTLPPLRTDIEFAKVGEVSLTQDAFVPVTVGSASLSR